MAVRVSSRSIENMASRPEQHTQRHENPMKRKDRYIPAPSTHRTEMKSSSEVVDVPEGEPDTMGIRQGLVFWGKLRFLNSRNYTGSLHLAQGTITPGDGSALRQAPSLRPPPTCLPDYNSSARRRGSSLNQPTNPLRPSYTPSSTSSSALRPSSPPCPTPREPMATASAAVAVPAQARARRPEEVTRVRSNTVKCRSGSMVVRPQISWCPEREAR
jgi:hypothetical protein